MTNACNIKGALLVLNSGSSSVKFTVFQVDTVAAGGHQLAPFFAGQLDGIGTAARLKAKAADKGLLADEPWGHLDKGTVPSVLPHLLSWIENNLPTDLPLRAAGHRVVHGGSLFDKPVLATASVIAQLDGLSPLAPLHQPQNLAAIRALAKSRPDLPQVACFDTAFHQTQPALSTTYAIPKRYTQEGVRRYGFHGLSYEYIAQYLAANKPGLAKGRVVVAHLGSGASLAALKNGVSLDTSMGFSALDGVPMGTRPGAIDPGIIIHLMRRYSLDADELERLLYHESGLLGVSGLSNDMRAIEASQEPDAQLAHDLFCSRVAKAVASLAVSMGGIDGLVFTAGIGEHSALIREKICRYLAWLGFALDPLSNEANDGLISTDGSLPVHVVPTDEEYMIASHTIKLQFG
ncbi:acetate/propionate family kinase [Cohaesibacter celericrescens]|uniref:Acetate kinase n=1 Tax=Cohaesibacter celericrescens TaxID=2067669 RepID=A0A2N5XRH1_9HYPH|nr:acetate/propionate family kinase [Cohaesibacter celericrescens]PLW77116.1 acetate kinase [Cohaesibacter celericrescens]